MIDSSFIQNKLNIALFEKIYRFAASFSHLFRF